MEPVAMIQQVDEKPKKLIIITGFDVFEGHESVNASWEAVRLLPDSLNYSNTEYIIEKIQVPVEYEAVDKAVEEIWSRNPELVIHCGVHGTAHCIHIEKLAYNHKFCRPDYAGKRLRKNSACLKKCQGIQNDVKHTRLNVDKICATACTCPSEEEEEEVLANEIKAKNDALAIVSKDVGNYLCGYIYLKSLDYDDTRTLFVHVPPVDRPLSTNTVCNSLFNIVKECIRQVAENHEKQK